jgi:hypothetical protein
MTPLRKRLRAALAIYLLLGIGAWATLDGNFRWIVLILMAALAVKSWIAVRREELP